MAILKTKSPELFQGLSLIKYFFYFLVNPFSTLITRISVLRFSW